MAKTAWNEEIEGLIRDTRTLANRRLKNEGLHDLLFGVGGWLKLNEAGFLHNQASKVKEGVIVEIGSYRGRSAIAMAKDSIVPVYAIDPHNMMVDGMGGSFTSKDRAVFIENIFKAGVHEKVHIVNLESNHAAMGWSKPIGLLWIDGDHSFKQVKLDAVNWIPHVIKGGLIAFHDCRYEDVAKALKWIEENDDWSLEPVGACGSIKAYRKA